MQDIIWRDWLKYILISLIFCYHIIFKFIAKDCGSIKTPLNGTKRGSRTTYPNIVTFTCDRGFNLKGSNVRECTSDGVWSGEEAFCEGNKTLRMRESLEWYFGFQKLFFSSPSKGLRLSSNSCQWISGWTVPDNFSEFINVCMRPRVYSEGITGQTLWS